MGTAGSYRVRDGVRERQGLVVCPRPLVVTRLNDAARDVFDALSTDEFRSVETVASASDNTERDVAVLLDALKRRGLLEWRPERDPSFRPPVSVVVTVRNEADAIGPCLDALASLSYPEYEVVVVDDGSTDGTRDVVTSHPLAANGDLRVVSVGDAAEPLGIGPSRNRGVAEAIHDVIAFTDADCRPGRDWLADLVPCLRAHDVVGGRIRPCEGSGDGGRSLGLAAYEGLHTSLDMGPRATRVDREGETPYLATANLVGRREVFEAVSFPDRSIAEDVDVCWRAIDAGYDVVYSPAGTVEHDFGDRSAFVSRRVAYGASEALLADEFGHPGSVAVPVLGVVVAMVFGLGLAVGPRVGIDGGLQVIPGLIGVAVASGDAWRLAVTPSVACSVSRHRIVVGVLRQWLSVTYGIGSEVARYYSLPIGAIAILAAVAGYATTATTLAAFVVACWSCPLVVDYTLHRPRLDPFRYTWWYVLDRLSYQVGVYRGALDHRTRAHVDPHHRFDLTV